MTAKANASNEPRPETSEERIEIDLKDPLFAAFLAWLIPGLGHWYQGRMHKAVLFFVCIMGTFIYGLYLGEGRVVYASMRDNDHRLPYLCQVGVGLPALPALIQAKRKTPIQVPIFKDKDFMAPPKLVLPPGPGGDDLDRLHKKLHRYWELGTVYTMIAGLLNVLAIYDAWGGPAYSTPAKKEEDEEPGESADKDKESKT